jgi:hypothetical protein
MPRQFAESWRSTGGQRLCHMPPLGATAAEIEFPRQAPIRARARARARKGGTTRFDDRGSGLPVA